MIPLTTTPIRSFALVAPWLLALGCAAREERVEVPQSAAVAPAFALRDVEGRERRPFDEPGTKAVALVFVLPDCPVANGYAPEVRRLCEAYEPRGVRFFLVHADPDLAPAEAARHARDFGHACPVVVDGGREWAARAGVTRVPEVAVFAPDGARRYRGRIDDLYYAPGRRRPEPAAHDLRDALDALLAGRPVPRPETDAVGCLLPSLPSGGVPR